MNPTDPPAAVQTFSRPDGNGGWTDFVLSSDYCALLVQVEELRRERDDARRERDAAEHERGSRTGEKCSSCLGSGEGKHDRSCSTCAGTGETWKTYKDQRSTALAEKEKLEKVVSLAAEKNVNGYDFKTLLEKIKQLAIDNGGFQNAYALSRAIEVHENAQSALSK